jgi:hypothetical protein
MILVISGVLFVIAGLVMTAVRTTERGRLSQLHTEGGSTRPNTLEPTGKGRHLSFKAGLPGLGVAALGAVLILLGSL